MVLLIGLHVVGLFRIDRWMLGFWVGYKAPHTKSPRKPKGTLPATSAPCTHASRVPCYIQFSSPAYYRLMVFGFVVML